MAIRQKRNKKVIGNALGTLDANAGHLSQTSRELNVPISTLWTWREHYANDPSVERYRNLKNTELADRFRVISALATERLFHEIEDVSVDKLATVAAIGTDKQLLLTGQATLISANADNLDTRQRYIELAKSKGISENEAEILADRAFSSFQIADETKQVN